MILRWRIIILLGILVLTQTVYAQTVRLTVLGGTNLDFVFNSIVKYKNGIAYIDYTTLGITVSDAPLGTDYLRWELSVEAEDSDGDGAITGSNPANTLPFSTIELSTTINLGCANCLEFFPGPPKLALPDPLADGAGPGTVVVDGNLFGGADDIPPDLSDVTDQITITYDCGTTVSLLGNAADYYADGIVLTLTMFDTP